MAEVQAPVSQVQEPAAQAPAAPAAQQASNHTPASQFDPSTLSPEAMAWVDRQRTQASQTARANARKDLMKDETFLAEIRNAMQPQVQKTMEEQMHDQIESLNKRLAQSEVKGILTSAGIPAEQIQNYVDLFADGDIDGSIQRTNNFVSVFKTSVQSMMDAQHQQAVREMPTPQTSATSVSEQQALQARLDEARKNTNFRTRDVLISSIMREASEKGITLI